MKLTRISFLFLLVFLFVPSVASAQKAGEKSWKPFWAKFTAAVKSKNHAAIKRLAQNKFGEPSGMTISQWLKMLDKEKLWSSVQASVNRGTRITGYTSKTTSRATPDSHLLFVYENGSWHFAGVSSPAHDDY